LVNILVEKCFERTAMHQQQKNERSKETMSMTARFVIFVCLPLLFGVWGLGMSYLQSFNHPEHEYELVRDFFMPVVLSAAVIVVIGFKTNGFKGGSQMAKSIQEVIDNDDAKVKGSDRRKKRE
jgi:hypothetical protein